MIVLICFAALLIIYLYLSYKNNEDDRRIKNAGKDGENKVHKILKSIANKDDHIYYNVKIPFEDYHVECDIIVINKYGVFAIEVKNYVGKIRGKEKDRTWIKYKEVRGKRVNERSISNPLKQLNRQVYAINKYLKRKNVKTVVKGCVYMVNANRPFLHESLVNHPKELDDVLHNHKKKILDKKEIDNIRRVFGYGIINLSNI